MAPQVMEMMNGTDFPRPRKETVLFQGDPQGCSSSWRARESLTLDGPGLDPPPPRPSHFHPRAGGGGPRLPLVLDADGSQTPFQGTPETLERGKDRLAHPDSSIPARLGRLVVDPRPKKSRRIRLAICQTFATEHQCFVVLKGHRTLIADPDGNVYVKPHPVTRAMANRRLGDVLTGHPLGGSQPRVSRSSHAILLGGLPFTALSADVLCAAPSGRSWLMNGPRTFQRPPARGDCRPPEGGGRESSEFQLADETRLAGSKLGPYPCAPAIGVLSGRRSGIPARRFFREGRGPRGWGCCPKRVRLSHFTLVETSTRAAGCPSITNRPVSHPESGGARTCSGWRR
jgi:hypothetical protein